LRKDVLFFCQAKTESEGGSMIETISIKEAVSVEKMKIALKNKTPVQLIGVNQFDQKRVISVTEVEKVRLFKKDGDECYFKGTTLSGKTIAGFVGMQNNDGHFGKVILHIQK